MSASISYLTVYNAHNGQQAKIPKPVRFSSLQKLKTHLQESFTDHIIASIDNIFLLTPFGIKLDYAMVNEMSELYLYDRRLFQTPAENTLVMRYLNQGDSSQISMLKPEIFPSLNKQTNSAHSPNIKQLSESLKQYEKWTGIMKTSVRQIGEKIDVIIRQINAIFKALNIIFSFASNFIGAAEKSFRSQFNFVKLLAMKSLHKSWKSHFKSLEEFPSFKLKDGSVVHLDELLDQHSLSQAAQYVSEHLPGVVSHFNSLSSTINKVNDQKITVDRFIEQHRRESMEKFENFDSERRVIMSEIDSLLAKVAEDMSALNTAPSDDLPRYYTRQMAISPQILEKTRVLYTYLESFQEFKNKLAQNSPEVFEKIATQQMKCVEVKTTCKSLLGSSEKSGDFAAIKEYEDLLSTTVDLPLLLGFVLIEKRRQFEWHDFYAKGIVTNISEQLTVIIEHEKVFQKLWNKKFGKLIKLINPGVGMHVHVPAIDVTLVNSGPNSEADSPLKWLGDSRVEREDVLNYIAIVRTHKFVNNDKFADLLERNFKDLVASTEKLKKITKTVASLGASSSSESTVDLKSQIITRANFQGAEDDKDLDLIRGLKSRIKKLEDLLHQQQFKNLTDWPVVKSSYNEPRDHQASLLMDTSKRSTPSQNPINLLPKPVPSRKSSQDSTSEVSGRKVLNASTTIDKHLENIRLRKEIADLRASVSKLGYEKETLASELAACNKIREEEQREKEKAGLKLESQVVELQTSVDKQSVAHKEEIAALKQEYEAQIEALQTENAGLISDLEIKGKENSSLDSQVKVLQDKLVGTTSETTKENEKLQEEVASLMAKLSDLQIMNAELLSNMQAKESEFSTERSDFENKIRAWEYKLDEKTEDFEALMEMTQSKSRQIEDLLASTNKALLALLNGVGALLISNVNYFHELCEILESMGLLLVHEINSETNVPEFRIRRVKGLRSKKDVEDSRPHLERTKSTAVQEVTKSFAWISEFIESTKPDMKVTTNGDDTLTTSTEESTHDAEQLEAETRRLLEKCNQFVLSSSSNDKRSKVQEFLKTIAFTENVQLQAHDDGRDNSHDRFFANGIVKRFNDVEGFAKKLTKENKAKNAELMRVAKIASTKLSVRDFQVGDLVLFLPTRIERVGEDFDTTKRGGDNNNANSITPWTAFNIDAPHYFLDLGSRASSISAEEWVVSRVTGISQHKVTESNARDLAANPFSLSVGITWYMLATEA